jgi:hypothetical protein
MNVRMSAVADNPSKNGASLNFHSSLMYEVIVATVSTSETETRTARETPLIGLGKACTMMNPNAKPQMRIPNSQPKIKRLRFSRKVGTCSDGFSLNSGSVNSGPFQSFGSSAIRPSPDNRSVCIVSSPVSNPTPFSFALLQVVSPSLPLSRCLVSSSWRVVSQERYIALLGTNRELLEESLYASNISLLIPNRKIETWQPYKNKRDAG